MKESFTKALAFVLAREGGKVDDPTDRGGRTNKGVTQFAYDDWRGKHGLAHRDAWLMDDSECVSIYHNYYWQAVRGDEMPWPVDAVLFDAAIQHGGRKAIELLQRALMITDDGILGPNTMARAKAANGDQLAAGIIRERYDYYAAIVKHDPSQQRFQHGWENRLAALTNFIKKGA